MILYHGLGTHKCPTLVLTAECRDERHSKCVGGEPFTVTIGTRERVRECVCSCHERPAR